MDKGLEPQERFYVAPAEPPEPRRPPLAQTGAFRWLRENFFKSIGDTIITLISSVVLIAIFYSFVSWAFFEAQWEVVFLNLRALSLGILFPQDQIWRINLVIVAVVGLAFLSVAIWGKISKLIQWSAIIFLIALIVIPIIGKTVPHPPVYLWAQENTVRVLNFSADEGQEISFSVMPAITLEDYFIENLDSAYYENNNRQAATSFANYANRSSEVAHFNTVDPSHYDLNFRLHVVDRAGRTLAISDFTNGSHETDFEFSWTAPSKGWFAVYPEFSEEDPGTGGGWIQVNNVEIFRSTVRGRQEIIKTYGEIPDAETIAPFCTNCVTTTARTSMRFEGERTLGEYISLQLKPFALEISDLYFQMFAVGLAAYAIGRLLLNARFGTPDTINGLEVLLSYTGGAMILLYLGIQFAVLFVPELALLKQLGFVIFATLMLCAFFYAILQFMKGSKSDASRGLMIIWLVSIPVIWIILTGFNSVDGGGINSRFPIISSQNYGGMLLTLVLSAVSIVLSFPIGVLLALGRQSDLPVVSFFCTLFIEVIRGVPLITLLFFGRFILPFFGLGLGDVDLVVRTIVMLTLFTAAYMAEVVRGGLQIIPKGQIEAAQALGLSGLWTTLFITLPQALRAVIPAIMGQMVSLFKDTSLVFIIGLFEMLGSANQILTDAQTGYPLYAREGYLYVAIAYFVFAYIMADISRRLERTGAGSVRRTQL
jgi:general L-amino acid transport system permease protein